jgi:membrane-associated phospholipid phosphatase
VLDWASSRAGHARLDALLGLPLSAKFYAGSSEVFGAMPSLHVSYATLAALTSWPLGGYPRVLTALFACDIAFSAVYLRHHYLLDVLAGAALGGLVHRALFGVPRGRMSRWLEARA